jgi:hypothetical protein
VEVGLKSSSSCIDAGDLALGWDPDGTFPEIGALWYDLPHIRLIASNGGENWMVFTPETISWRSSNNVPGNVKIKLSIDAGDSWSTIINSTANSGSGTWSPMPEYISDSCLIKIKSESNSSISDKIFSLFSITGDSTVYLWIDTNLGGIMGILLLFLFIVAMWLVFQSILLI